MAPRSRQSPNELPGWKVWGLPVFAAIFSPWQEKITSMTLISEWFQPTLNVGASVIGPLTCMVGYMALNGSSRRMKRIVAIAALAAFLLFLLACLFTKYFLQSTSMTSTVGSHIAWTAWAGTYLFIFMSFGLSMVAAFQLRVR